mmetsp:Transcript_1716/g.3035  ORF Transcript_1716/g.3035 Transcript_1716/m.3035 type:complete len:648 (-) Transcript_1716:402-2345(-)
MDENEGMIRVLSFGGHRVRVWLGNSVRTQLEYESENSHSVLCTALSSNGMLIAYGCKDGSILVLKQISLKKILQFHPTQILDSLSNELATKNSALLKQSSVYSLCFSNGSRYLCAGFESGLIAILDIKTSNVLKTFESNVKVKYAQFSPSDTHIAVTGEPLNQEMHHEIQVFSVISQRLVQTISAPEIFTNQAFRGISFCPLKKSWLAAFTNEHLFVFDLSKKSLPGVDPRHAKDSALLCHLQPSTTAACTDITWFSNERHYLISTHLDGSVSLFHVALKKEISRLQTKSSLSSISLNVNGDRILLGTTIGRIDLYEFVHDETELKWLRYLYGWHAHSSEIHSGNFLTLQQQQSKVSTAGKSTNPSRSPFSSALNETTYVSNSNKVMLKTPQSLRKYSLQQEFTPLHNRHLSKSTRESESNRNSPALFSPLVENANDTTVLLDVSRNHLNSLNDDDSFELIPKQSTPVNQTMDSFVHNDDDNDHSMKFTPHIVQDRMNVSVLDSKTQSSGEQDQSYFDTPLKQKEKIDLSEGAVKMKRVSSEEEEVLSDELKEVQLSVNSEDDEVQVERKKKENVESIESMKFMDEFRLEVQTDVRNLHLDVIRLATQHQEEILQLKSQNEAIQKTLMDTVLELRSQNQLLRSQLLL